MSLPIKFSHLGALILLATLLLAVLIAAQTPQRGQGAKKPVDKLPSAAKRWAIIVGVDDYESSEINRLSGAVNDAKALADALVRHAGFPEDQVILLASDQPPQRRPKRNVILRYLTNLSGDALADGLLLFAFAGHGIERNGRAFLLPADAQSSNNVRLLEQTALAVDEIKQDIRATGARQVVVILDACRNDPTAGRSGGDNPLTESFIRGFNFDLRNREVDAFVTLHAASRGQRAYEFAEKKQGYFTFALIEGLKGRAANERGEVTLANLLGYLEEKVPVYVRRDLGERQKPYAIVEGYRANELVLAVTGAPAPIPTPASKPTPTPAPTPRMSVAGVPLAAMSFTTANVDAQGRVINRRTEQCWGYVEDLGNGVKLEMVEIPAGEFLMGEDAVGAAEYQKECERYSSKDICASWAKWHTPQHRVRMSGFLMGKYEVTQAQWRAVAKLPKVRIDLNSNPSRFEGDDLPVEQVSWEEAVEFCERLSQKTGGKYRLPTEAEWEYVARAGTRTAYAFGATISPEIVNYDGNYPHGGATKGLYREKTVAVGSLGVSNAWGLFDLHGNVWEWCEDIWHESYSEAPTDGSAWQGTGSNRVIRGGGWIHYAVICRSADRHYGAPGDSSVYLGFRLVRVGR